MRWQNGYRPHRRKWEAHNQKYFNIYCQSVTLTFYKPWKWYWMFFLTPQFISLPSLLFSVLVCWLANMGHSNMFLYLLVFCQALVTTPAPCHLKPTLGADRLGELVESLKRFCASTRLPPTPLLLFPEEEATNGREGLLHFRWVNTGIGL